MGIVTFDSAITDEAEEGEISWDIETVEEDIHTYPYNVGTNSNLQCLTNEYNEGNIIVVRC